MVLKYKNIVLGICGGIAAYKSCDILRHLVKLGANVECILTKRASEFVTPLTLQTLSKNKVQSDMFEVQNYYEINHISLAQKADVILIVPATADIISRLAHGRASDLLTCTVLASKAKILICPAMNADMFNHKATQSNIETLKSYEYEVIMPEKGELACGNHGYGRLAQVKVIVSAVKDFLQ
ncbi:MAG: phosphopantothenoylcysteine decarboxylase [Endomicrobium sp.]|jgi:phosphopantothenoylcysteine decarboxylase/phosphopantothenate--cysteine ligase|nr:phosphopantothenoylcysteine decarboxylase [Endomicrobium sp.]